MKFTPNLRKPSDAMPAFRMLKAPEWKNSYQVTLIALCVGLVLFSLNVGTETIFVVCSIIVALAWVIWPLYWCLYIICKSAEIMSRE
jgi:hypothetical protein